MNRMAELEKPIKILESCLADWGHGATMVCSIMTRIGKAVELLKEQQPEIIYCADCPKEDREECEKQYGRVQNEWCCRFGKRKGR